MKYVRTRDNGIYKSPKDNYILVGSKEVYIDFEKAKQDGCRIADTIEELCDEAVYGCLSVSVDDLKKDYECWEVYGAIWTDKGLIYVAKMNEKGELELI